MIRRDFIKNISTTVALGAIPSLKNFAFNHTTEKILNKEIFVFVFLRGGCDALNLIGPYGDRNYADLRTKNLRVDEIGGMQLKNGLDGFDFGFHTEAKGLKELYDSNQLAVVHACGIPNGTRSHFEAMSLMERGLLNTKSSANGWITRYLETISQDPKSIQSVSMTENMTESFLGATNAVSMSDFEQLKITGSSYMQVALQKLYQEDELLISDAQKAIQTLKKIQTKVPLNDDGEYEEYNPSHGASYPEEWQGKAFSESLKNLARLIKLDMGTHMATIDFDGWDTHENQSWIFKEKVRALSEGLVAFYNDLSNYHNRLTIVVMSEFGRRVKSNRSSGTDHGYGGLSMILGGNVKGGKMYGSWPGLSISQLDKGVDLNITTDYRTILAEVLQKRLNSTQTNHIFPDFKSPSFLDFI